MTTPPPPDCHPPGARRRSGAGSSPKIGTQRGNGLQNGDHNTQHNYFGARRPSTWPHRVGVVPALADCRLFRPADRDLAAATVRAGAVVVCQVLAGPGGVGKTQLAANLAHRLWAQQAVDLLVWVTATSRTSVVTRFAQAAADITGIDDPDPEQAAGRLLAWLASTDRRWLVVLDDLVDPSDLVGLWPPKVRRGTTVVTTRRRDSALLAGRHLVDVDLFTPEQAVRYLSEKLGHRADRLVDVAALAADLGYLPLALAQAATYMADQALTCVAYRQRLARRRLAEVVPLALPDEHRATVGATWSLSLELADRLGQPGMARRMLEFGALLDPNGIPAAVFTTGAVLRYCADRSGDAPVDIDYVHDAIRLLHRLSLAVIDDVTATVRIHGLLQRAVRETMPVEAVGAVASTAADALVELWPRVERDRPFAQLFRGNVAALRTTADHALWNVTDGGHPLLLMAGRSLGNTGLVAAAVDYFDDLRSTAGSRLGSGHPFTLITSDQLIRWQGATGDAAGAVAALKVLLVEMERVLGADHPATLAARTNLLWWQGRAGDYSGAAANYRFLVSDYVRVLGPDDPGTLTARDSLAWWQGAAGDPGGAAEAYRALFTDCVRVLGADDPMTLKIRHSLAWWQGRAGDLPAARSALTAILADYVRIIGADHPYTLAARGNLANWRGQAGDPSGAVGDFRALLVDRLRVLGVDHPDTLATRHNIARWQGAAGDAAGAVSALQDLLTDMTRALGQDHPDTLIVRTSLARWQRAAGDPAGAATALAALVADMVRVLGPDHPDTMTARENAATSAINERDGATWNA